MTTTTTLKNIAGALLDCISEHPDDVESLIDGASRVLEGKRLLHHRDAFLEIFESLYNERYGIVRADVVSTGALSASQVSDIESYVKRHTGKDTVDLHTIIDPDIGGGIKITIGNEIIDYSIRSNISKLHHQLTI